MSGTLILASASESRRRMLEAAGIAFETILPRVDEEKAKNELIARNMAPSEIAVKLAELKALQVSQEHQRAFVIGADQVLACEGVIYGKAKDMSEAKQILRSLRGRKHELLTAAALAKNGTVFWQHVEPASLWMRDFSEAFLDNYLAQEGNTLLACVGCYRIEGAGARLFTHVEGDRSTIQGLPLTSVLAALRADGVIAR